jgi:hypothetical protein
VQLPDDVIAQVERRLDVQLDRSSARTGAWAESAGYCSDRGTWVRVDSRARLVIQPQSWVGAEATSVIPHDCGHRSTNHASGWGLHWDSHDVLCIQPAGEKN